MPEGQIVRAVGGFYDVRTPEGDIRCRARGILKKKNLSPLVGDYVIFERTGPEEGVVTEVRPRRTQLIRPPIANVEQAVVLFSLREPPFPAGAVGSHPRPLRAGGPPRVHLSDQTGSGSGSDGSGSDRH